MPHGAWACIQPTARLATGLLLSFAPSPRSSQSGNLGDGTGLTCVVDLSQRPPGLGIGLRLGLGLGLGLGLELGLELLGLGLGLGLGLDSEWPHEHAR